MLSFHPLSHLTNQPCWANVCLSFLQNSLFADRKKIMSNPGHQEKTLEKHPKKEHLQNCLPKSKTSQEKQRQDNPSRSNHSSTANRQSRGHCFWINRRPCLSPFNAATLANHLGQIVRCVFCRHPFFFKLGKYGKYGKLKISMFFKSTCGN